jgi:hypothetical protein
VDGDRGAPENKGYDFTASQSVGIGINQCAKILILSSPVVRTNPVTGWKSLFGAGHQVYAGWIDNVTETESEVIKAYCESTVDI